MTINIISFSPTAGPSGTVVKVTLSGLNTDATTNTVVAWIGSSPVTEIVSVDAQSTPQTVTIKVPNPSESGSIKIGCTIDRIIGVSGADFTVTDGPAPGMPSFDGLRPTKGPVGTNIILEGKNLDEIVRLEFANRDIPNFRKSDAMITFKVPSSLETGFYHAIGYTKDDQTILCHKMFEVTAE